MLQQPHLATSQSAARSCVPQMAVVITPRYARNNWRYARQQGPLAAGRSPAVARRRRPSAPRRSLRCGRFISPPNDKISICQRDCATSPTSAADSASVRRPVASAARPRRDMDALAQLRPRAPTDTGNGRKNSAVERAPPPRRSRWRCVPAGRRTGGGHVGGGGHAGRGHVGVFAGGRIERRDYGGAE